MSFNNVIKSSDPDAVTKLQENIDAIEKRLEYMQTVNDFYRQNGTTFGCPAVPYAAAVKLDARVKGEQATPYPGQFFMENRHEIDRLKGVADRIRNHPETVFKGWKFEGGEAVVNLANNRLQLMFSERPSDEQIAVLKQNYFKWAPKSKAWQRSLSHQTMSLADKVPFIKTLDGRKPTDIQPRPPKKNEPER